MIQLEKNYVEREPDYKKKIQFHPTQDNLLSKFDCLGPTIITDFCWVLEVPNFLRGS